MKKIVTLSLLIFFFQHFAFSQDQHLVDSLQGLLSTANGDTNRIMILFKLSSAYIGNNPDTTMDYTNQALDLSEKIGYKKGIGIAYNILGLIYNDKGDYSQALELHRKALKIREEMGDKPGIAGSYNNIGNVYEVQGDYPEALKSYFAALEINQEIGNKPWQAANTNNIGLIYEHLGNYPEALKNYFFSLRICEEIGDKEGIGIIYNNIGIIYKLQGNYSEALENYFASLRISEEMGDKEGSANTYGNIGNIYYYQRNYPEALKNHLASLKIYEEIGGKQGIARAYENMGIVYEELSDYPKALKNYFASLEISMEIGEKLSIASSSVNIGKVYTKQVKNKEASEYLRQGLSMAQEIGNLEYIKESYFGLAALDSSQGNFKKSLEYYKMGIIINDSMFNKENTEKIVQSKMQYEFDKKESLAKAEQEKKDVIAQKELQKQKWVRNGFIGGFAAVLIFAFIFFRQRNKIKREKKISEEERKKSEAEKKRSEELLLNILPSEVAEELKNTGQCQAKTFSMVTVMFTDFKDFTSISEKVSAELLVAEINHCFSAFDQIVNKYNVEKIKTVGDAYMCVSGLPVLNYTHAFDVVNAALEIRNFMISRKIEKEARGEISFEIRIGIHTGPVVAGIVGVKKFQYDIWGDTVNLAARMESSGEAGQVNISGTTFALVKTKFNCIHRGKIVAKNKGELDMYFVESFL
jgi:adenylate cyclase